jgi:hypothetical protein
MTNPTVGEVADVGLVDKVYQQRRFHNDHDKTVETQEQRNEIPEDIMDQIEAYLGDGNAHLTVSGSLSSSHEYHKAESFVSVSVTCNNNMDDIRKVHEVIRPFVQSLALEDHNEMSVLRDQILPPDKRKHLEDPKGPAVVAEAKPSKIAAPPQRSASIVVKPGSISKPTFKR